MTNPWGSHETSPMQAVLLALSIDSQAPEAIALKAGLHVNEAHAILQQLIDDDLAILENGEYELSGPLSWFGNFEAALKYYARRNFVVTTTGGQDSHLYLTDVRVKHGRPVGDPLTETLGVLGCGKTARDIRPATEQGTATCEDCRRTGELHAR